MKKFWLALAVSMFFFVKVDILIWQRIFETNELWELGMGVYHTGWRYALYGFMALGALFLWPDVRRAVQFPVYLWILSVSGLPDILYYWVDGRPLPEVLPWLEHLPTILKPITSANLVVSAVGWITMLMVFDIAYAYIDKGVSRKRKQLSLFLDFR